MQIAVYGGSFNPPHVSHAMVASWLTWTGLVDQVWLVPVYRHAFEQTHDKKLIDFDTRMEWCRLMGAELGEQVVVSDIESTLPTPSYSIDTLKALQRKHPEHTFRLVVGADVVSQLPQWKQWSEIEKHFTPIIVGRVGYEGHRAGMVFPNVSSTDIRKRLRNGDLPKEWLLKSIADWFQQHPDVFLHSK